MKKEDFLTYYSKLSNVALLKIIHEKEKYRQDAIEAATEILAARTYSDDENAIATTEVNIVLSKTAQQQERVNKTKTRINDFIDTYFGIEERSSQQKLNLFCVAIFVYSLINAIVSFKDTAMLSFIKTPGVTCLLHWFMLWNFSLFIFCIKEAIGGGCFLSLPLCWFR